jgi:rubrerythrin
MKAIADRLRKLAQEAVEIAELIEGTDMPEGLQIIACEACGASVKQRTVWQRFCPTCSAERKAGVLRSKSRKRKA